MSIIRELLNTLANFCKACALFMGRSASFYALDYFYLRSTCSQMTNSGLVVEGSVAFHPDVPSLG